MQLRQLGHVKLNVLREDLRALVLNQVKYRMKLLTREHRYFEPQNGDAACAIQMRGVTQVSSQSDEVW